MTSVNAWTAQWAKQKNLKHFYLPAIESTNAWAKTEFRWDHKLCVFTADHQSHGRGRGQHSWTNSTPGATWMCTWSLALDRIPHPLLNIRIGLKLYQALKKTWPITDLALKAPNDIYLGKGKLAGILTEVVSGGNNALFIGIGMNVFAKPDLPEQITQSLSPIARVDTHSWFSFCDHLHQGFHSLLESSAEAHIAPTEKDDILSALKNYTGNTVADLLLDGTLILNTGYRIHWNEL